MRYTITGRNIEVTQGLKDAVEEKLAKLDRYFADDTLAKVSLSVQRADQKIEITIPTKLGLIRAEETTTDMYSSIDLAIDLIEKQIKKYKSKLVDKKQSAQSFSQAFFSETSDDVLDNDALKIVKVKKFAIKPMDPEEAVLQMEMLGHAFFVFLNSETENVNVVYKRKNGTYGIIEPESQYHNKYIYKRGAAVIAVPLLAFITFLITLQKSSRHNLALAIDLYLQSSPSDQQEFSTSPQPQ